LKFINMKIVLDKKNYFYHGWGVAGGGGGGIIA
jgi:hypothetical protein